MIKQPKNQIKPHICNYPPNPSKSQNFCRNCGLLLSKTQKYFRSSRQSQKNLLPGNQTTAHLLKNQNKNRYYNISPPHKSYRKTLINWIKNLLRMLKYSQSTYHLSIAILDSVFSMCVVKEEEIKLVGFICLFMAGKMNEKEDKIPSIEEVVGHFKNEFCRKQFWNCENTIFELLKFNLNIKTPFVFLSYFLYRGILNCEDVFYYDTNEELVEEILVFFEDLSLKILDFSLDLYDFYQFISVAVASACIACARKIFGCKVVWTKELFELTSLSWNSIEDCSNFLFKTFVENNCELIEVINIRKKELMHRVRKSFEIVKTPIKNCKSKENNFSTVSKVDQKNKNLFTSEEKIYPLEIEKQNLFKNYDSNKKSNIRKNEKSFNDKEEEYSLDKKENISQNIKNEKIVKSISPNLKKLKKS